MEYLGICALIYILMGAVHVVVDYLQPIEDQPAYARERHLLISLLMVLLWPILGLGNMRCYIRRWRNRGGGGRI